MNDTDSRPAPAAADTPATLPADPAPKKSAADRADRILTVVALVCGVFTLAVFGSYFVKITIFPEGTLPIIACALVFAWLALPFILRIPLRRAPAKARLALKAFYTFVLAAFTVTFIAMCVFIFAPREETPYEELPEGTVVVVFGAKVNASGSPGTPLARRLRKAAEILDARPDTVVVVSGGKGDDEPISEAESMKRWLASAGIDESRILVEDQARNTRGNISYSRALLEENGMSDRAVACVSSDFHIARIMLIGAKTGGFGDYYYRAGGTRTFDWDYFGLAREYVSFARIIFLGAD